MSEIKQQGVKFFKEEVSRLLAGEIDKVKFDYLSIGDVKEHLDSIGEDNDDYDTNGWQHDYWNSWTINNENYTLAGCGYYGGIEFFKNKN